jgi:hypothetical protein
MVVVEPLVSLQRYQRFNHKRVMTAAPAALSFRCHSAGVVLARARPSHRSSLVNGGLEGV